LFPDFLPAGSEFTRLVSDSPLVAPGVVIQFINQSLAQNRSLGAKYL
jgi:hypothetical protein